MTEKLRYVCLISLITMLAACGGGGGGGGGSSSSSGSSNNSGSQPPSGSHRAGEDCMSSGCHDGTSAGDQFYAAGTVYGSGSALANATVRLYISNTNSLSAAMTTDSNGNFYSLDPVDGLFTGMGLVSGTDVEIQGSGGARTTMPGLVTNGSCNSCHGDSVGRINAR